jgi:D-alanyl-D-alanine carboxypeptidase (penicillin-binding protein 5/6)
MLVPRADRAGMKARVIYAGPIEAPIAAGDKVAALVVDVPGRDPVTFDLVAGTDVARGGLAVRLNAAARLARDRALDVISGN